MVASQNLCLGSTRTCQQAGRGFLQMPQLKALLASACLIWGQGAEPLGTWEEVGRSSLHQRCLSPHGGHTLPPVYLLWALVEGSVLVLLMLPLHPGYEAPPLRLWACECQLSVSLLNAMSARARWWLETSPGGNTYAMETDVIWQTAHPSPQSWLLNIYQHIPARAPPAVWSLYSGCGMLTPFVFSL